MTDLAAGIAKVSPGNTTYYVDPVAGSDDAPGTEREKPWQSFAALNAMNLAAGDCVEVIAAGRLERTLRVSGRGTTEAPITIRFAPGRYDIYPDQLHRQTYNISNCNDDAENPKAAAVLVEHACHVRILGPGAQLVCRGKMIELCIDDAEDVLVSALSFDYERPTVSEFTVVATGEGFADLTIHPDSDYTVEKGQVRWLGEGWEYDTGLAQELVPETHQVWRRKDPLVGMEIEETGPFRIRAHGGHDMVKGHVFQLRDTFRDCVGVFMRRSKDVVLDQLHLYFMHGMGVLCQYTENITLDTVCIAPNMSSGRTTAAWADCTHFSGCRGKVTMKDCLFCGAHDDASNVHGTYLRVVEQVESHQVKVRFVHRQTYGFMAFYAGDKIQFVHGDSLAPFGENRVTAAELISPREILLTLETPVPTEWREDDVVENLTWTPEVEISGCKAMRIPSRGFLLTTRHPAVITDNTFVNLRVGIHLEMDALKWFESGAVRDMTIRGNRFLQCQRSAIRISPDCAERNDDVHRNIRILENKIDVPPDACAIEVGGVTGLKIAGNRMHIAAGADPEAMIQVRDCAEVVLEDNTCEVPDS